MKLNRKGFTLIEALAVIIILSMLMVITVPNVNKLINRQKDDALKNTEKSIISAAKIFFSDYKYEVTFSGTCNDTVNIESVKINNNETVSITDSKLPISVLIEKNYIKTKDGYIINPKDNKEVLDICNKDTVVNVSYNCNSKNFEFKIDDSNLKWNTRDYVEDLKQQQQCNRQ